MSDLGGPSGQRPEAQDASVDIVTDASSDYATNEYHLAMCVGVPGRQRFQKIFVRKTFPKHGSGGKTNVSYDAGKDAPAIDQTISIIPTAAEIQSSTENMEFLVVGVVIAANPSQFIRCGHAHIVAGDDSDTTDEIVRRIINDIAIWDETRDITTLGTVTKLAGDAPSTVPLLSGLRLALLELVEYFKAEAMGLREQHVEVTKHASISELMVKIGNCVDIAALKDLEENVFAIHAEQLATANGNGIKYLQRCIENLDQALANIQ